MNNELLLILAVLVTLTQGFSSGHPWNYVEDSSDVKRDFSMLKAFKLIVNSSFDKFSKCVFNRCIKIATRNFEYEGLKVIDENSGNPRVNMDPERVTFAVQLEAILSTMLNLRPKARSKIFAAQEAATIIDERFMDYLGEAIAWAKRGNFPGNLERINALEKLTQRSPEPYNVAVFGTFRICTESPEIIAAINEAETQANLDYHKLISYIYNAVRTAAVSNDTCDVVVLSSIAEQKLLVDNYYDDSVNVEFDLIKSIYKSFEKPEPKNEDEGIKWTEIYSYSNATENCSCYSSEDSSDYSVANQNQTANSSSNIGALQNIAINYIKESIVLIFDTIRTEANKAADGSSCKHEYNEPVTEMSDTKAYITLKSELDVKLNAVLIAQPEASKIADNVRQTIYSRLSDMLTGVKCGTDLIAGKYSSGILKRMETLQNDTVSAAIDVCDNVYTVVMNGRNSSSAMGEYITASRKKADSILVQLFETVFTAIKLVMSQIFPTLHFENFECSSSLESLENNASSEFVSVVETIFVAINSTVERNCRCECVNAVQPYSSSRLIGRTHDSSYSLYRLGERLSQGARQYVETGRGDGLDAGGESPNTLHSFVGPPVPQGEGASIGRAFLDSNHTLVSVMARINPSPDWFIGVDSFQLCVEGNWVDTVTVELDPLDGGTDNGFTFTAANWPTQPQGVAYRITSRYPAHPAGSFYYPNLPRLPPLATLTFTKLREYTLTEKYHEDDVEMEFVSNDNLLNSQSSSSRVIDPNHDLNEAIAEERREMDAQRYRYWTTDNNVNGNVNNHQLVTDLPRDNKEAILHSIAATYIQRGRPPTPTPMSWSPRSESSSLSKTSKGIQAAGISSWPYYHTMYQQQQKNTNNNNNNNYQRNIISDDRKRNTTLVVRPWGNFTAPDHLHRLKVKHHRVSSKGKHPRNRVPRDCKVGEWGAWSACSRSCGVGETQRTRKVTVKPRRGGSPCPPLKETKWCGSASPCSPPNGDNGKSAAGVVDIYHW